MRIKFSGRMTVMIMLIILYGILTANEAAAELFVSGYFGISRTHDSDVKLDRPGETYLKFSNVSWDDGSFKNPIYYGFRGGYWFKSRPDWGVALDFTHAKMYGKLDNIVNVSGTRSGLPVSGQERLGDTFEVLEFSDGINLLTINGMHRWDRIKEDDRTFLNRMRPYVLAGLGVAIPHVEVTVEGSRTFEYQATGLAGQAGGGLSADLSKRFSVFAEYKLSYADIDTDLNGGGSLKSDSWIHHFSLGVTFSFLN